MCQQVLVDSFQKLPPTLCRDSKEAGLGNGRPFGTELRICVAQAALPKKGLSALQSPSVSANWH